MVTILKFYRLAVFNENGMNMKIIDWLNKCAENRGDVHSVEHYWRDNHVLVTFDYPDDAMAFKLAFDLPWESTREIRI